MGDRLPSLKYPMSSHTPDSPSPYQLDIARIGCIQNYGALIAIQPHTLNIISASQNTSDLLGVAPEDLLGNSLELLIPQTQWQPLVNKLPPSPSIPISTNLKIGDRSLQGLIHRNLDGLIILEFEQDMASPTLEVSEILETAQAVNKKIKADSNLLKTCEAMASEMKRLTEFDRVMIYQYDPDFNGKVIAEAKNSELSPFLDLHFPAQDIQVTLEILEKIWVRFIPDISVDTVPLLVTPDWQELPSLDLTYSTLRGCSPCHQEYLHNMGVRATLVFSLKQENQLWGLIACHHYSPKLVPYSIRKTGEFLSQLFSAELITKNDYEIYEYRVESSSIQSQLLAFMGRDHTFVDGLVNHQPNLLDLVSAQGAVIFWNGAYTRIGITPENQEIYDLIEWLDRHQEEDVFYTQNLASVYPGSGSFASIAVGLLALHISQKNYILWFRPEVLQTVTWGGNPYETLGENLDEQNAIVLSPRRSFEAWKEVIKGKSLPWKSYEIEAVHQLRKSLIHVILNQVDELSKLTQELERSNAELEKFAYIASHDLQEPLNLIASYVELLEMRYQELFDQDGKDFLGFVVQGVSHMQSLIDDLLAYSRVGRKGEGFGVVNVQEILRRSVNNLQVRVAETDAVITYDPLPTIVADSTQLTQLFQNLISNALKFHGNRPPEIHVGVKHQPGEWLFWVKDNGIGIDPEMSDRIFIIFQRLHTREEYPGTGIGLAICKKIVEFHGGRIWVESQLAQGSIFYFTLAELSL